MYEQKDICFELNHTRPSATNKRKELIDQVFQTTTAVVFDSFNTDYRLERRTIKRCLCKHQLLLYGWWTDYNWR